MKNWLKKWNGMNNLTVKIKKLMKLIIIGLNKFNFL